MAASAAAAKKQERQAHVRKVFAELFNIPDNKVSHHSPPPSLRCQPEHSLPAALSAHVCLLGLAVYCITVVRGLQP